jgi:hypothetical protein
MIFAFDRDRQTLPFPVVFIGESERRLQVLLDELAEGRSAQDGGGSIGEVRIPVTRRPYRYSVGTRLFPLA